MACDDGADEVMAHFTYWSRCMLYMVGATFEEGRGSGKRAGEVKLFPRLAECMYVRRDREEARSPVIGRKIP